MFEFRFFSGAASHIHRGNAANYTFSLRALATTCALALTLAFTAPASAQPDSSRLTSFDIPSQALPAALSEYARQSGLEMLYSPEIVTGLTSTAVDGDMTRPDALRQLLQGTGLEFEQTPSGGMMVGDEAALAAYRAELAANNASAGQQQSTIGQRRPGIEEIIVTGQKREERIQDVPIAISAFTQEDLTTQQIAGGPDLHLQVPNMTFTKTNFTGYSIQIRGIGTQAISATTDPAVAVALNQTPFIRNRFFEQEFYDLERLEVLRGPQGTLFGRNATAGVVNLITAKPQFQDESMVSLDVGNYNSRRWEFMINKPLVDDQVALRIAGAGTQRDGYAVNELTDSPIDGRDLWSSRVSLRFTPNDRLDMNLIWEHFEEDDDRLRSGKQLCKTDEVTEVAGHQTTHFQSLPNVGQSTTPWSNVQATFSQGCKRNSLYAEDSFQTPNGFMLGYYIPLGAIGLPIALDDPYVSRVQSRDLRKIESTVDPEYRASSDIGELQISYQLTDGLVLNSETAYMTDEIFSMQDFNRFNTAPGAWLHEANRRPNLLQDGPQGPNTVFCDPQIGCSDRLVAIDVSTAESSQFSQEFRLSSEFGGPFNFSLGANFLRYDTVDKYYVFANSFTLSNVALWPVEASVGGDEIPWLPGETTNEICLHNGLLPGDPDGGDLGCTYIDPNPIGSLNDLGHQYFLSKNPFNLRSYGIFGETYWNVTDTLKLTAGLRWSVDHKDAPLHPTWLFVDQSVGHPETDKVEQTWREPTGRLVLDWQPVLDFTDETLIYGSVSRGYKAGGANPPLFVPIATIGDGRRTASLTRPQTFDAEFVNAFEVGTKNTLLDGGLTLNAAAFYYDYKDYQISELVDRSAFNKNYDAEVWGAELEANWWATERLRLSFKGGYQKTRIADGEKAIDLMNRVADGKFPVITDSPNPNYTGDPGEGRPASEYEFINSLHDLDQLPADQEFFAYDDWTSIRPFAGYPSSCLLPTFMFDGFDSDDEPRLVGVGALGGSVVGGCEVAYLVGYDPVTGAPYAPQPPGPADLECGRDQNPPPEFEMPCSLGVFYAGNTYPGWDPTTAPNGGEGIAKDLSGNELPNAPHYTTTLSADYVIPLNFNWSLTLHTDLYWQSKAWWRIFNDHEYSRLDDYFTMNLAAILKSETGWDIMAYIKNVTNETAITGAFLYTDDVGLTTNTFLTEPRLYGIRATKRWDAGGGPIHWMRHTAALFGKEPGEPTPLSLTLGGQLLRPKDSPNEIVRPTFITEFDPNIDPTGEQAGDMDWGDGREIELTYAPADGWRFSLGARFGESNRERRDGDRVLLEGERFRTCIVNFEDCEQATGQYAADFYVTRSNYGLTEFSESEEHLLIDFMVGRDVGLGALESRLSAGLRYAQFKSRADGVIRGTPDWDIPEECWGGELLADCNKYAPPATRHEYIGTMEAEREFEGLGPVVAWDASMRLFGNEHGGHIDLDASLSGGLLFGKQKTLIEGTEEERYFVQILRDQHDEGDFVPDDVTKTTYRFERSESARVATLGTGLGLTYRIDGFSIGAGYQWERYFDAIDGGVAERKEYDRTVDGPYLKVTFGGGS